ncbi:MAG: Type 1 glutamine amidotransferase-like domain-containing protein [bacterium]
MKLFLFGGAEIQLGQFIPQLELIEKVILEIKPKQILHIPFARTKAKEIERELGRFTKNIHLDGIEYLNATNEEDIVKAENPLIFISGGGENMNLVHKIQENPTLRNLVQHAEYIIGESA